MSSPHASDKEESDVDSDVDSDATRSQSETSTLQYTQEPYETFQHLALKLGRQKIWPDAKPEHISVERLKGGGYNRITGMFRHFPDKSSPDISYILRVPRFEYGKVDRDVAALQFLLRHTRIPAARVTTFDESRDNEINQPYMVQKRLDGRTVLFEYPSFTHAQKCKFAREFGQVYNEMLSVRSNVPGTLVLPENDKSLTADIHVEQWHNDGGAISPPSPFHEGHAKETVYESLTAAFKRWSTPITEKNPNKYDYEVEVIGKLSKMAAELEEDGWLTGDYYCLSHHDFVPHNILVNATEDEKYPIITAILDWDSAVIGPQFLACTPPLWVWGWLEGEDEDERTANDEPATPEQREYKRLFEEAAGPIYARYAYNPVYRLARRLVRFAFEPLCDSEQCKEADRMLDEWITVRKTLRFAKLALSS